MLEKDMYSKLKKFLSYVMLQRIETTTNLGVPDIAYAYQDMHGWMELKELKAMPKSNTVVIPWRPGQLAWYYEYAQKYKNEDSYILCLTIGDEWYFITRIKESYTKDELEHYHLCNTKQLINNRIELYRILFG